MSGRWKGADKPGGAHFVAYGAQHKDEKDCPKCKYGTLIGHVRPDLMFCIDCKAEFTVEELKQKGVLK